MKKKIFLSIIIFIIVCSILVIFWILSGGKPIIPGKISPTPSPTGEIPLSVLSIQPENNTENVSLDKEIVVSFDRQFTADEISFSIAPLIPYDMEIINNELHITPLQPYDTGMPYSCMIKYLNSDKFPEIFAFRTLGPTPTLYPNTGPNQEEILAHEEWERNTHPDLFLSNKTPYQGVNFSVTNDFKTTPTEHFFFIVAINSSDFNQGKNEAISWMKSLGLTDQQISSLDIIYQNQ